MYYYYVLATFGISVWWKNYLTGLLLLCFLCDIFKIEITFEIVFLKRLPIEPIRRRFVCYSLFPLCPQHRFVLFYFFKKSKLLKKNLKKIVEVPAGKTCNGHNFGAVIAGFVFFFLKKKFLHSKISLKIFLIKQFHVVVIFRSFLEIETPKHEKTSRKKTYRESKRRVKFLVKLFHRIKKEN